MKKTPRTPNRKLIAVASSDNHLQQRAWHGRRSLYGDAIWAFRYIAAHVCANPVPLILAGDVIDKQENGSSVPGVIVDTLAALDSSGSPIYFIQGQHELQEDPWLTELDAHDRVWWLETGGRPVGDFHLSGLDWGPKDTLDERLAGIPDNTDILVMHQVCEEWMGSITDPELAWHQIPGGVRLLIVGDFHDFSGVIYRENAAGEPMKILCPGSTAMQSITEPVKKYFYEIYDDLSINQAEIPTRRVLAPPDLTSEAELDYVIEHLEAQIADSVEGAIAQGLPGYMHSPILYIKYAWDLPDAYARLTKAASDKAHLFLKELLPKVEETPEVIASIEERQRVIDGGLLGGLADVAPDQESARYKISHRLLSSPNKREAMMQLREEYIGHAPALSTEGLNETDKS